MRLFDNEIKGTSKRTKNQLETEVENMGAHLNAFTSRDITLYHMQVLEKYIPQAADILGDIMMNSVFNEAAIEAEKGTITQELEELYKDTEETFMENVYTNVLASPK